MINTFYIDCPYYKFEEEDHVKMIPGEGGFATCTHCWHTAVMYANKYFRGVNGHKLIKYPNGKEKVDKI